MVSGDENVKQKWANVQTAYQRRIDLIPNLISTVKASADFEKKMQTDIAALRTGITDAGTPGISDPGSQLVSIIREKYPDLSIVSIPGPSALISALSIAGVPMHEFIFLGFIEDYELVKLYQQAKLNVLLSRDEGFGFSYIEAANFGCPSVLLSLELPAARRYQ